MAPLKMEDEMKQRLENRRIEPSSEAWQKLSARLEKTDQTGSNRKFWWLGIAAASVVILLMLTVIIQRDKTLIEPTVVETEFESNNDPSENSEVIVNTPYEDVKDDQIQLPDVKSEQFVDTPDQLNKTVIQKSNPFTKQKAISNDALIADQKHNNPELETRNQETIISQVGEKLNGGDKAEIANRTKQHTDAYQVSDDEIDGLLREARLRLNKSETIQKTNPSINANALLLDIEDDLDKSFRERVFRTLVSGYESVKTTVAERNN
ncbi:MAG: hypothetical protein HKN00_10710 [Flavobacteriaceae bacterium]|nr:hypothetical protein [Bacteroidia bacterium]NNF75648.1 hypothetical protein [Flavobacteriaceae bacterium]